MMEETIGFIGCGNMGKAMIGGIIHSGLCSRKDIIASAHTQETLDHMHNTYGIVTTLDNHAVAKKADIIFLAIKPYLYDAVLLEIKDDIKENTILVAIAAGQPISHIQSLFDKPVKIMRAMPNTPAMVLEAMSALSPNDMLSKEDISKVVTIFESFGKCEIIPEKLMDAVVGVSGSSPAYVYLFIEAMADAAVADGMPRAQAYKFAAQSVLGAAKMVLETGTHPGALKDAVCSPGGTTIEAVTSLEQNGFRGTVMKAQRICTQKSKDMSLKSK